MDVDVLGSIHSLAASGQLTPRAGCAAAHALGGDPDAVPVPCEVPGCGVVKPHGQMFSMWVVYGMPGLGMPPYHCPSIQHYGCSHEHAKAALLACLNSHIESGAHL